MRLAKRHRFFDRLPPCGEILEADGARIAVAKDRFDALPAAPPILSRTGRLSGPFLSAPIAPERLAESARRIHAQLLRSLWGEIVRCGHGRGGCLAAPRLVPAIVPLFGARPSIGTVLTQRHGIESKSAHLLSGLPEGLVALHDVVPNFHAGHGRPPPRVIPAPPRIAAILSVATVAASRACIAAVPPNRCGWRASHHRSIAARSKLPVVGSACGNPRASKSGSTASSSARVLPRRRAATSNGTSRGSMWKRMGMSTVNSAYRSLLPARRAPTLPRTRPAQSGQSVRRGAGAQAHRRDWRHA